MAAAHGHSQRQHDRVFAVAALGALVATTAFLAWLAFDLGGPHLTDGFDDIGELAAAVCAAVLCGAAGVRSRSARASWWLVGAACLAWSAGEAAWTYYDLADGVQVPFPSLADIGFLVAVPLMLAGLVLFPGFPARAVDRARSVLDGAIIAMSVLMASWVLLLGPIFHAHRGSVLRQTISLTYPVSDVLMISLVLILLNRSSQRRRLRVGLVLVGVVALAVSDSSFAYFTEVKSYSTSLFDTGWVAAFLLIGLGALREMTHPVPRLVEAAEESTVSLVVSYVPVLLVLAATSIQLLRGIHLGSVSRTMAYALGLLVLAREAIGLWTRRRVGGTDDDHGAARITVARAAAATGGPEPGP